MYAADLTATSGSRTFVLYPFGATHLMRRAGSFQRARSALTPQARITRGPTVKKSRLEIARAALRLAGDGPLCPVAELVDAAGAPDVVTLLRWIVEGRGGVFFDGIKRNGRWYSSQAAVERFKRRSAREKEGAA